MGLVSLPNPHFILGYTGFCPQYKYCIEDTYRITTHKGLLDSTGQHVDKIVLTDRTVDDHKTGRPVIRNIGIVNERQEDTIYKHPIVPGYKGFMSKHAEIGQRYTVQATKVSDFEWLQTENRTALNEMNIIGYLQDQKVDPKSSEDNQLVQSGFKFPLVEIRPERGGLLKNVSVTEQPVTVSTKFVSYFSDNIDSEKYLKAGFLCHMRSGYTYFGKTNDTMINSSLCKFGFNYNKRLRNEWVPLKIDRLDHSVLVQTSEIYHKHVGQLPSYGGHIPGAIFRYGKTYGNDSRDAKRWLRGDFCN